MRKKSEQDMIDRHFHSSADEIEDSFEEFLVSLGKAESKVVPPEFLVFEFGSRRKNMNNTEFRQFLSFLTSNEQGHMMDARMRLRQSLLALVSNMEIRSSLYNYQSAVEASLISLERVFTIMISLADYQIKTFINFPKKSTRGTHHDG